MSSCVRICQLDGKGTAQICYLGFLTCEDCLRKKCLERSSPKKLRLSSIYKGSNTLKGFVCVDARFGGRGEGEGGERGALCFSLNSTLAQSLTKK